MKTTKSTKTAETTETTLPPSTPAPNPRALSLLTDRAEDFRTELPAEPRLAHMDPARIGALLGVRDVDALLADQGLRYPLFTMSKDGSRLPGTAYTYAQRMPGSVTRDMADLSAVGERLAGGGTVILEQLHRTWRPVGDFCRRLGYELGRPVGANAYLTPPSSQGFGVHYDTHGAFILQVAGRKTWELNEPISPFPLEDQRWREDMLSAADRRALRDKGPHARLELVPGDVLWVPRGWLHEVFTTPGSPSLHITLGVPEISRYWLASKVLADLAQDEEFRRELPLDAFAGPERAREESGLVLKAFAEWLLHQEPGPVADRAVETLRTVWYPTRSSAVASVLLTDEEIARDGAGVVVRREALWALDRDAEGGLVLRIGDRNVVLAGQAGGLVEGLLTADDARVVPVGEYVSALGPEAFATIRTLLVEGVGELV